MSGKTVWSCILSKFYIKPQQDAKRQTADNGCILSKFYIKPQLSSGNASVGRSCILSKFYIKPQLEIPRTHLHGVVSYRNSTSNHNRELTDSNYDELYLIEILHQTTTLEEPPAEIVLLYLIEILHQTTTRFCVVSKSYRCILSKFYIKPQHSRGCLRFLWVVSYRNSTSNHNISH